MAMGWISALKLVPWGDVIENAPKVAQGAKKLWNAAGKKSAADASSPLVASERSGPGEGEVGVAVFAAALAIALVLQYFQ